MTLPAALDTQSPEASAIGSLIWSFTGLLALIWVLVVIVLVAALTRRHAPRPDPIEVSPGTERRVTTLVSGLAVLTGAIVVGLTVISYAAQQRIFSGTAPEVEINVIGHQFWWELRYDDPNPSRIFTTANELHVPVGRLVKLNLSSVDVIHSFWVPSLMGKADLVPGRGNELRFTADKPGVYAGTCAEFCGLQHAHMGIRVFADAPEDFEKWKASQIASAAPPENEAQQKGAAAFLSSPCVSCHAIRGTQAGGALGPDLTHLASRTTIAAGTAELTRGTLAAWITDPQSMKPGTTMPTIKLEPDDLESLLDYLTELK